MSVARARPFGELLRHYRLMAGLSPRGISDLERGVRRVPRPSTLTSLAEALGLADQERAALFAAASGPTPSPLPDGQQADSIGSVAQSVLAELPSEFPPLKTLDRRSDNLPIQPTTFVGRSRELAYLQRLLDAPESRLLTLVGPGGIGKTRLAVETAH